MRKVPINGAIPFRYVHAFPAIHLFFPQKWVSLLGAGPSVLPQRLGSNGHGALEKLGHLPNKWLLRGLGAPTTI